MTTFFFFLKRNGNIILTPSICIDMQSDVRYLGIFLEHDLEVSNTTSSQNLVEPAAQIICVITHAQTSLFHTPCILI